jgi:hypothetical protein
MRSTPTPRKRTTAIGPLARAAVALYPPAWRARYGDEILTLLEDSGGGLVAVTGVAWRAVPVWVWPPEHLHDRDARMRASLATVLVAWSLLAGLGLVFAQLTQLQGFRPHGHPVIGWSYAVFDVALAVSVLVAAIGSLPLWLVMLRRARREHSPRDVAYMLVPVAAPVTYIVVLIAGLKMVRHASGIGPWWFAVVTVLGFAAAGAAAAGPGLALRRLRPRGPAVRLATITAAAAVATMLTAAAASGIASTGLYLWARDFAGYHDAILLGGYLAVLSVAGTVALVTTARGSRAALAR